MTPDTKRAIEDLFDSLVELRPDARRGGLDDARSRDPGVACEVERLLAAHDASTMFIERPAYEAAGALFEERVEGRSLPEGARIGRYRVIREIGRGGMGEVYLAARDDAEFEQLAAIKVVKRGMDTDEILSRFRAERQTLASLRHPNITRLLDGGATDDGRPYLVMEHIEGLPIDRHCEERRLPLRARMELFATVCDAVHAAHTNLVVHRDLKPSNILVDADGSPKLLDFGVARVLSPDGTAEGERTVAGLRLLTPQFASPEQLRGERVTTSTDVYSLGLILCVMLTGRRPFEGREREGFVSADDEPTRRGRPTRPSRLVADAADAEGESARARLAKCLRGDIDTIVLKALRVEPGARYLSAEALADDVRRHLRGLPVSARPQTAAYSVAKFVRRRPWESAMGALAASAVVAALGVSLASLRASERAREAEMSQRALAERSAEESRAVVDFMRDIFASIDPFRARGRDTALLRETLDEASGRPGAFDGLSASAEAAVRTTLGSTYRGISEYAMAEAHLVESVRLAREGLGERARETVRARRALGVLRLDQSRHAEAAEALVAAIAGAEGAMLADPSAGEAWASRERLAALEGLAVVRMEMGEFAFAEETLRALISAEDAGARPSGVHDTRSMLAVAVGQQGRYEEAATILRERLSTLLAAHGEEHPGVISVMNSLGVTVRRLDRHEEAAGIYERAGVLAARVFGPAHRNTLSLRRNLAIAYEACGRIDEAGVELAGVLDAQRESLGMEHADTIATASSYAQHLSDAGRWEEGETLYREALAAQIAAHGESDRVTGILLGGLGSCLRDQGRYEEAEVALLRGHGVLVESVGAGHPLTRATVARLRALYGPGGMNDAAKLEALGPATPPAVQRPASAGAPPG